YIRERGDGISHTEDLRRWWMFSQEKDNQLSVAFCDTGIGIPRSIKTSGDWSPSLVQNALKRLGLGEETDAALIRSSIELHESRTGEQHRGRGLGQILDVVRRASKGQLMIHSNSG